MALSEAQKNEIIHLYKVDSKKIIITGNLVFKDDKIKENVSLKIGSILNIFQIRSDIARIEVLYKEKHYYNAKITYKIHPLTQNQAELELIVDEGKKVQIRKVTFQGNDVYKAKALRKIIKTKGYGIHENWGPSGWFTQKELAGGGALADMGVHAIDTVRYILGDPKPVTVYAQIRTHYGDYDVDGISGTVVLLNGLKRFGVEQCSFGMPQRIAGTHSRQRIPSIVQPLLLRLPH